MKRTIFSLLVLILPACLFAQETTAKLDVSDWGLFSIFEESPQINRIDENTLYAYYRSTPDKTGIMIFDKKMNIIRDIPIEIMKTRKVVMGQKALSEYLTFPYTFYRPDNRSIVIVGYTDNGKKSNTVVGATYSVDGAGLLAMEELRTTVSDKFMIRHSSNDEFFVVAEYMKAAKGEKTPKVVYDVFNKSCEKIYSATSEYFKDKENYFYLMDNGELITYNVNEKMRYLTYVFTRHDATGTSQAVTFSPPKTDVYNYDRFRVFKSPQGEYYSTCLKLRSQSEGIAILKLDFDKKTAKKITDKNFDKATLARISTRKTKSVAMLEKDKGKPIEDFDTYYINRVITDDENIYLILEDYYTRTVTGKTGTRVTHGSRGIMVACYGHDGKEKWITPVRRMAARMDDGMNLLNGNGMAVQISTYDSKDMIYMLVRSGDKTFYTGIDKKTGNDITPVELIADENIETNANCMAWFDEDEFVILTIRVGALFKRDFWLQSFKVSKPAI